MDFIAENYLWFIIIGVVLLMALVGFIAEKTDFGRKNLEKASKRPKKEKIIPIVEEAVYEPEINEEIVLEDDNSLYQPLEEEGESEIVPELDQELYEPLMETNEEVEEIRPMEETVLEEIPEVEEVPMVEETVYEPEVNEEVVDVVDDSLYQSLEAQEDNVVNETNEEVAPEIALPAIEEVVEKKDEEQEDVWRF